MAPRVAAYDSLDELIQRKEYRQALSLIEKKIKKGDKSDVLQASHNTMLQAETKDPARRNQGEKELDALLDRSPPVTSTRAIQILQASAESRHDHDPRLQNLWVQAAQISPQDEGLYKEWFETKFSAKDFRGAQKASMAYMKNFPSQSTPFFWTILTNHLISMSSDASEQEKHLHGQLACRMLEKAAANVPQVGKKEADSSKALRNVDDINLLLLVYEAQGKYTEALKVLDDPCTGIYSAIGKSSRELKLKKIKLLELNGDWQLLADYCVQLLGSPLFNRQGDNHKGLGGEQDQWIIWEAAIRAKATDSRISSAALISLLYHYLHENVRGRSARAAILRLFLPPSINERADELRFRYLCKLHFSDFSASPSCFLDLRPILHHLNKSNTLEFLKSIEGIPKLRLQDAIRTGSKEAYHQWINSETNQLSLHYRLCFSRPENSSKVQALLKFIRTCLKLYAISKAHSATFSADNADSDQHPGDDAAMLVAMAFVRLHLKGFAGSLLRAIAVLEHLLTYSPRHWGAIVILNFLYIYVGTPSLATEMYARLDVKNLQNSTLSWIFATRLSTVRPNNQGSSTKSRTGAQTVSQLELIMRALDWHSQQQESRESELMDMLHRDKLASSINALHCNGQISTGFNKYLLLVEYYRIQRLSRSPLSPRYEEMLKYIPKYMHDNRDARSLPDAEAYDEPPFYTLICPGLIPNGHWLYQQLNFLRVWSLIQGNNEMIDREQLVQMGREALEEPSTATSQESGASVIASLLDKTILLYRNHPTVKKDDNNDRKQVLSSLKIISTWHSKSAKDMVSIASDSTDDFMSELMPMLGMPDWSYFHHTHVGLDTSMLTLAGLDLIVAENRQCRIVDANELETIVIKIRGDIFRFSSAAHQAAARLKVRLLADKITEDLVEDMLGQAEPAESATMETESPSGQLSSDLRFMIGEPFMHKVIERMRSSWIDALDGILSVKVA